MPCLGAPERGEPNSCPIVLKDWISTGSPQGTGGGLNILHWPRFPFSFWISALLPLSVSILCFKAAMRLACFYSVCFFYFSWVGLASSSPWALKQAQRRHHGPAAAALVGAAPTSEPEGRHDRYYAPILLCMLVLEWAAFFQGWRSVQR